MAPIGKAISLVLVALMVMAYAHATDDPLEGNVFHSFFPVLNKAAASKVLGVTIQLWWIAAQSTVRFEAWAMYHPTAKGRYLRGSIRRPSREHTIRNKNIAIAYATHRLTLHLSPHVKDDSEAVMVSLGLDPHDKSVDVKSPVGVGNVAAKAVIQALADDGMNHLGNYGGHEYNKIPFEDYTGYTPVNTHNHLYDPDRWQPWIYLDSKRRPISQIYLTPQVANLRTLAVNLSTMSVPYQEDKWVDNRRAFIAKTKHVMDTQLTLTDEMKIKGEFFDNKVKSLAGLGEHIVNTYGNGHLDYHTVFNFIVNNVIIEVTAGAWGLKTKHDASRPFTAVRFLHTGRLIRGWGGPGKGNVLMDGKDWASYLPTDAFPDYPSGTSCVCSAWTEAAKSFIGNHAIDYSLYIPAGSSVIEPGHTPKQGFHLTYDSLDQVAEDCMNSRVWGGVHFQPAVEESRKMCKKYGPIFHHTTMHLVNGN